MMHICNPIEGKKYARKLDSLLLLTVYIEAAHIFPIEFYLTDELR